MARRDLRLKDALLLLVLRIDQTARGMEAKRPVRKILPHSGQKRTVVTKAAAGSDSGENYVQLPSLSLLLTPTAASGVCKSVGILTCKSPCWRPSLSPGKLEH